MEGFQGQIAEDLFSPPQFGVEGSAVEHSQVGVPWQEGMDYLSCPAEWSHLQGRAFISPLHTSLVPLTFAEPVASSLEPGSHPCVAALGLCRGRCESSLV